MNTGNKKLRKLSLNRETLMPLDSTDLEQVNGGTSTIVKSTIKASQRYCSPASKWVTRNLCPSVVSEAVSESIRRTTGGGGDQGGQH
jgi:hypothetical protein